MKYRDTFIHNSCYKIYPGVSKPAYIYELPKIQMLNSNKGNLSLRPITSSIGTYNYNLSKFLSKLLALVIPTTSCIKNSFTFCEEWKKVGDTDKLWIFYGICSLLTSMSLKETTKSAVALLFEPWL